MAKNPPPGDGHRHGQVTDRSQTYNPQNDRWVKRDTDTGRFIDQKADPNPFALCCRSSGYRGSIVFWDFQYQGLFV